MIIQLDWFGCNPRSKWESQIHLTLEQFAKLKPISRAVVRVNELPESTPRYQLTMNLSLPGPDVLERSTGHTFDEALLKLQTGVRKTLMLRAQKSKQLDAAPRGVQPSHRV
jgi:hypothetical protein